MIRYFLGFGLAVLCFLVAKLINPSVELWEGVLIAMGGYFLTWMQDRDGG